MWHKAIYRLNKWTEALTMLLLFVMVLLVFFQVCSRALFNTSFSWTNELARYMMVWVVFLGGGIAFQYGAHIGIEALFDRFSKRSKKILQVVVTIICISFFIILIVTGMKFVTSSMTQTSPALKVPMGLVYLAIPLSGLLQIINVIDITVKDSRAEE